MVYVNYMILEHIVILDVSILKVRNMEVMREFMKSLLVAIIVILLFIYFMETNT